MNFMIVLIEVRKMDVQGVGIGDRKAQHSV